MALAQHPSAVITDVDHHAWLSYPLLATGLRLFTLSSPQTWLQLGPILWSQDDHLASFQPHELLPPSISWPLAWPAVSPLLGLCLFSTWPPETESAQGEPSS